MKDLDAGLERGEALLTASLVTDNYSARGKLGRLALGGIARSEYGSVPTDGGPPNALLPRDRRATLILEASTASTTSNSDVDNDLGKNKAAKSHNRKLYIKCRRSKRSGKSSRFAQV